MQIVDNVFVKMHNLHKEGDVYEGHSHTFDHITLLASGKVLMEHDNGSDEYTAPYLIVTPKGIKHQFTALADNTLFCCVHAIRDGDGIDDVASPDITKEQAFDLLQQYPLLVNSGEDNAG